MSTAPDTSAPAPPPPEPAWKEFARAPLVPLALAVTAGLIADRYGSISANGGLLASGAALLAWVVARARSSASAALWLWVAAAALAAAYHHAHRHSFAADDIGR